jgi:hypothetical protein
MTNSADFGQHVENDLDHKYANFFQPYVVDELANEQVSNSEIFQPCFPMCIADLFQPMGHVCDSQNQRVFSHSVINNSEIFRILDVKNAENFQPSQLQISVFFYENMARNYVFGAGNCWGQQVFQFKFVIIISSHPKCGASPRLRTEISSRSEFFTRISISYLFEEGPLLEQPTPLLLEGVNDVLHADLPLKRHTSDIL